MKAFALLIICVDSSGNGDYINHEIEGVYKTRSAAHEAMCREYEKDRSQIEEGEIWTDNMPEADDNDADFSTCDRSWEYSIEVIEIKE